MVFAVAIALFSLTSCTYDYFEDDTNYVVFVPQVKDNTIGDCKVMIYNEAGELVKMRYAKSPWGKDPNINQGLFRFKLFPGNYKVYCYTNTEKVSFKDESNLNSANFVLLNSSFGSDFYEQPSTLLFDKLSPQIIHPGVLVSDTANLKSYTDRVTIRFKHVPEYLKAATKVQLIAEGVATKQYLKQDTITTRISENDKVFNSQMLQAEKSNDVFEFDHYFFPSIVNQPIRLNYSLFNQDDSITASFAIDILDEKTGLPIPLYHGKRIIIEIDASMKFKLSIVDWNEDIESGDTDLE